VLRDGTCEPIEGREHSADDRQAALEAFRSRTLTCRRCVEAGHIPDARPIFSGRASDGLMVIGQAPGAVSDRMDHPFSGPAGKLLSDWLVQAGFPPDHLRVAAYLTSLTRCFPGKSAHGEGDRPPSRSERLLCREYLDFELRLVRPGVILLVGKMAIEGFLGPRRLDEVVGTAFERSGAVLIPLPHSSGVSRWLNAPEHRTLVSRAIDHLSSARVRLGLGLRPPLAGGTGGL
jgi:uracil-DNA glycosylase